MEIRDYVRQARREPTREHLESMWQAIFTLKAWYFLPARREEGPNRPLVMALDGADWLPVCTNVRRYRSFAESVGRGISDGEMHALILNPGESVAAVRRIEETIEGVVFNPGSEIALRAPVEAVVEYARHFDVLEHSD